MEKLNLSAAILIGLSTRMGRDKALLTLGRQTFISHLVQELSICEEVFISTTLDKDYSMYGVRVIRDEREGVGPMEGIRQSLCNAAHEHVFICAVDMPFLKKEIVEYLAQKILSDTDICVFREKGRVHPLCGIYKRAVLPVAENLIAEGRYRMMDLLQSVRTNYIDIEDSGFSKELFINVNTPEEYAAILKMSIHE